MNGEADNLDSINEQFDNMVEQGTGLLDKEGVPCSNRSFSCALHGNQPVLSLMSPLSSFQPVPEC